MTPIEHKELERHPAAEKKNAQELAFFITTFLDDHPEGFVIPSDADEFPDDILDYAFVQRSYYITFQLILSEYQLAHPAECLTAEEKSDILLRHFEIAAVNTRTLTGIRIVGARMKSQQLNGELPESEPTLDIFGLVTSKSLLPSKESKVKRKQKGKDRSEPNVSQKSHHRTRNKRQTV